MRNLSNPSLAGVVSQIGGVRGVKMVELERINKFIKNEKLEIKKEFPSSTPELFIDLLKEVLNTKDTLKLNELMKLMRSDASISSGALFFLEASIKGRTVESKLNSMKYAMMFIGSVHSKDIIKKEALIHLAKKAVDAKLLKDPKQIALKEIEQEYKVKKTKFKIYGFSAQFIRDMADKYPIINSQKTIEKLVARLNKENADIPR